MLVLLPVLLLALAACGDDDDDEPTPSTTTTAAEAAAVVPGWDGIAVGDVTFAFGTTEDVAAAVEAELGEPMRTDDVAECPAGPATGATWEDVQLVFQDGAFVGWSMGELSQLTTDDGLRIGSTLDEVRERHPDVEVIPDSTLGVELYAEAAGLSGLLTEDAPTGTVTSLWAGIVCTFR